MTDQEFDVVVVGSGGAGMTAALTAAHKGLSVVIIEKAERYGGSTARSGGGVWIPDNAILRRDGANDDREEARLYARTLIGDVVETDRIDTYIDRGPEMLDFVLAHSPLKMQWVKGYSDYYPEAPGGRVAGRSIEPKPFDLNLLGEAAKELEPDYAEAPAGMVVLQGDYKWLNLAMRHPRGPLRGIKVGLRLIWSRLRRQHLVGRGQALAAGLRGGLLDAGVPVWLNTPLTGLEQDAEGRVTGVRITRDGEQRTIRARHGVVLASGGFEHNAEMRAKYQRQPIGTEWTVGAKANTGDGINAGIAAGADVDFMADSWWGPSIPFPGNPWFALAERSLPRSFMINERGERFMNESLPYVEAVHRMYGGEFGRGEGPGENVPAWLVFDQTYLNRYMFAARAPRQGLPGRWFKQGVVVSARSMEELAEKIGVPADNLAATTERFNGFARAGSDADFGRGESGYDHYYGDITNKPNPSLGELTKAPFYAVKMVPGDLGTKGGIRTDVDGRALRADGSVIPGLYAAGNCSSPVMGHTYAGPGATIGPAMVFGYLSVLDIAARAAGKAS